MNNCLKLLLLLLLAMPKPGLGQQEQDATLASLLAAAQKAQVGNDYEAAAQDYKQAVKLRPDIPELWANLGLMQYEARNYDDAAQSLQHAHRLKPSLYVPNLFLGVDYVRMGDAKAAIPYLLKAETLNRADSLPLLTLGRAYASLSQFAPAAHAYARAIHLDAGKGSAWFGLGIARLDQVEQDARRMTDEDQHSPYTEALFAESLVKQSRYREAASLYKSILAAKPQPPCIHAELGFLLLRQQDAAGAEAEFKAERQIDPGCSLAMVGQARMRVDAGSGNEALALLEELWRRDPGFLQSSASALTDGVDPARASAFLQLLTQQNAAGAMVPGLFRLLSGAFSGQPQSIEETPLPMAGNLRTAGEDYSSGRYAQCASRLQSSLKTRNTASLQLLAACAWFTGDYDLSSRAAEELAAVAPHSPVALYWSVKANERLAFHALDKYEQLEPNSARSHLLLGDMYRQRGRFDNALAEYRKALAISPNSAAALLGLASAYFGDDNLEKTVETARLALEQTPNDPELNLLMGEALVAHHQFADARPFLEKALNAKPQMLPHVHALLGQVYAEAGQTRQAIAQLKLGAASDEDGSLHYQLARLYRKTGDDKDAAAAIEQMKLLQKQRRQGAVVALRDSVPSDIDNGP